MAQIIPTPGSQPWEVFIPDYQLTSEKNQPGGYAGLTAAGKLFLAQVPNLPESQVTNLTTDLATLTTGLATVVGLQPSGDATGATDSAAIIAAAAALPASGGTIELAGGVFFWNTALNLDATTSVTIKGKGGRSPGSNATTRIQWVPATAPMISARSSFGFRLVDVQIAYQNAAMAGKLIDLSHVSGNDTGNDSAFASIERCTIQGTLGTAVGATALVSLMDAHDIQIRDCLFGYAVCAIRGKDGATNYCNRILVMGCEFGNTSQAPIQSAGQAWHIDSCTFEQLLGGGAGGYSNPINGNTGMTITGCWFGDANNTGIWLDFAQAPNGIMVQGCFFSGGDTAINLSNSTFGVTVKGNRFLGNGANVLPTGINVTANCSGLDLVGNYFQPTGGALVTNHIVLADKPLGSTIQRLGAGDTTSDLVYFPGRTFFGNYGSFLEIADPGNAGADQCRLYARDNGAGKTQLVAVFSSGAVQVIATQP